MSEIVTAILLDIEGLTLFGSILALLELLAIFSAVHAVMHARSGPAAIAWSLLLVLEPLLGFALGLCGVFFELLDLLVHFDQLPGEAFLVLLLLLCCELQGFVDDVADEMPFDLRESMRSFAAEYIAELQADLDAMEFPLKE